MKDLYIIKKRFDTQLWKIMTDWTVARDRFSFPTGAPRVLDLGSTGPSTPSTPSTFTFGLSSLQQQKCTHELNTRQ